MIDCPYQLRCQVRPCVSEVIEVHDYRIDYCRYWKTFARKDNSIDLAEQIIKEQGLEG